MPFSAYEELMEFLGEFNGEEPKGFYLASKGSGRRIEVYAYKGRSRKDIGIPVFGYALGLHGLTLAEEYLREKAEENGVDSERLRYLKLGLKKRKETKAGLKVGIVWEDGKPVEIAMKLSTTAPRVKIQGLYGELVGKSRGELVKTDEWYFVVHASDLYWGLRRVRSAFGS